MTYALYGDSNYPYQNRATWTGSTWAIVSNKAVNTPTFGAELLANAGFEGTYTAGVAASWAKGTATGTAVESADARSGSKAQQFTAVNAGDRIQQAYTATVGLWYQGSIWAKRTAGSLGDSRFYVLNGATEYGGFAHTSATYAQKVVAVRATSTTTQMRVMRSLGAGTRDTVIADDASLKAYTLSSMFATIPGATPYVIARVGVTLDTATALSHGGLVLCLDSAASPANFLICYQNGTQVILDKCAGGTYTNLFTATATYSAGATLQVTITQSGGSILVDVTYNSATVGTQQTVSDAGIVSNTIHGMFSSYSGNALDNFSVYVPASSYYVAYDTFTRADGALGSTENPTGEPRYYGVGTWPNSLWGIAVDWDGDGLYDSTNEAMYAVSLQTRRGRDAYLNIDADGNASGFEPVRVGAATLIMDNSSRRYDPYNTSSPLYPNVIAGKNIQIRVADPSGNIYYVITGKIRSITTQDDGYEQTATFEIEDGMRLLQSTDATVDLQQDPTIDEAIGLVLDDVNWPTLWGRNLDASADVIPYWWGEDKASTELRRLAEAELGEFFVAANGAATFRSRSHADVAVLTLDSSDFLKNINVALPWEVIRNQIKVYANPRVVQTATDLWTMQDVPSIAPGASLTVWANYQYNGIGVPAINVIAPVMTTDCTANTAEDGTGTDRTSILYITLTDFGKSGKLVITNTGADTVYITLMKVRGDAISKPDATLVQDDDATSQGIYGKAQLVVNNDWIQTTAQAGAISGMLIGYLPNPQKTLTVRIEARPDIQFTPDLFDTLDVTIDALGITNVTYRVTSIEHRWTVANGQSVLTTWKIEPDPNFA